MLIDTGMKSPQKMYTDKLRKESGSHADRTALKVQPNICSPVFDSRYSHASAAGPH